LSYTRWTLTF